MPKTKKKSAKPDAAKPAKNDDSELRALVKELKASLKKAESQTDKWKARAKAHGAAVTDARTKVSKLEKKLAKATREASSKARPRVRRAVERAKDVTAETVTVAATAIDPSDSTRPDASWTVTRLRAHARTEGVAGYSRMTKDQLLSALR